MGENLLQAQLKRKLTRREEDMEDLLTSNVFGSLKYVLPQDGLSYVLTSAEDVNGNKIQLPQDIVKIQYDFWPQLREADCNPCEPDVLLRVNFSNGQKTIILVEAKYHSDKSSIADDSELPTDQLAREWHNLVKLAETENSIPLLLYVTADIMCPVESIIDSQNELQKKNLPEMNAFWVSWRRIHSLFKKASEESILADLTKVLELQGLTFYERKTLEKPVKINWAFKVAMKLDWGYGPVFHGWSFNQNKNYNWRMKNKAIKWRFDN
jgi:hypothetical protein